MNEEVKGAVKNLAPPILGCGLGAFVFGCAGFFLGLCTGPAAPLVSVVLAVTFGVYGAGYGTLTANQLRDSKNSVEVGLSFLPFTGMFSIIRNLAFPSKSTNTPSNTIQIR